MPELYIISGSNGAGKSSVGSSYLPNHIFKSCEIFDGDKLFMLRKKQLWDSGIKAPKEIRNIASHEVAERFDNLVEGSLENRLNFVYEGHFTNDETWNVPRRFKNSGFSINMIFLGLQNPDLSELRVTKRVKEGGHFVNRFEVESNFFGNLQKLNLNYEMFDTLQLSIPLKLNIRYYVY